MTVEEHVNYVIEKTREAMHDDIPWPWNLVQIVDCNKATPWEVLESMKKLKENELEVILQHYLHGNTWFEVSMIMHLDRQQLDILHMQALDKMRASLQFDRETERVKMIAPTSIRALGLPKVISNALFRAKIISVYRLLKMTDDELLDIQGLGVTRVAVIRETLSNYLKGDENAKL